MIDRRIVLMAEKFWRLAGKTESFPRSLEIPMAWALPVAIVKLPHLALEEIDRWLKEHGVLIDLRTPNRAVRACLVVKSQGNSPPPGRR